MEHRICNPDKKKRLEKNNQNI